MALFMKQDFSPPILSRKWLAIKFRPNMLIYSREHIITILESGLLFREDSIEVEQEAPCPEVAWGNAGGVAGGWLTKGERNSAFMVIAAFVVLAPPRNVSKLTLVRLASLALIPIAIRETHRSVCHGTLRHLVTIMRDYMSLVRRAMACSREYAALYAQLGSVSSAIESTNAMLYQQQRELLVLMSRATSALLGNVPWLRGDVTAEVDTDSLMKLHHAFLVVQSTLLKYIALAHYIPAQARKLYKNHNERIYWIHNVLIDNLTRDFKDNFVSLERMYRLLKHYGTKDSDTMKTPGTALNDNWFYSDIHTGVARSCLELKLALNKCNDLDMFLDSCALNNQELDLDILNKDIDVIVDNITKCLNTVQGSQIRLKKLQNKFQDDDGVVKPEEHINDVVKIDDKEPEIKDEVFYFVRTDDDDVTPSVADVVTGPGEKEKEATKVVMKELKRKLVRREDLMRERERQALAKTMPELENVPEFPRQIDMVEFVDRNGFLSKLKRDERKKNTKISMKMKKIHKNKLKYGLKIARYTNDSEIDSDVLHVKSKPWQLTLNRDKRGCIVIKWIKIVRNDVDSSGLSEGLSDVESDVNSEVNKAGSYKFDKGDLLLSSSDSDYDNVENRELLNDIRRYRAVRKKNFPAKRASIEDMDEGMKPIEYRFGTGMAMASVLQINKSRVAMAEEVFVGNGEVSEDSGNDEDV